MPFLNSMGNFRAMSILPSGTSPYYFNALNLKNNGDGPSTTKLTVINDKLFHYGFASVISGAVYLQRPYVVEYDVDGTLKSYKIYADEQYTEVCGYCVDSTGNKIVLLGQRRTGISTKFKFRLLKYDSTDSLIYTKEINGVSPVGNSIGRCFGMVIDSSDNVYVGLNNFGYGTSSGICVLKFDTSFNLTFTSQVNPSLQNPQDDNIFITIDSSNNIILTITDFRTTPNDISTYVVKMNSSGVVQWTRQIITTTGSYGSINGKTIVDSTGNVFVLVGSKLVKILANGTVSYKHSLGSTNYDNMYLNSLGNLVLISIFNSTVTCIAKDDVAPTTSVSVSTYYTTFNFQFISCNSNYTFVNNYFSNGVDASTLSVIKIASNGYPPNLGTVASFSQTNDDSVTHTWNNAISISLDSNISITDATMTVNNITTSSTSITTAITNVTQATGITVPVVYATPLK